MQVDAGMMLAELDCDFVFEVHGLHKRPEIVEPLCTAVENSEDEIDLGGSEHGDCRGWCGDRS